MMEAKPQQIASLWIGGALSFLEHLSLKSFVDFGHPTRLYTYGDVANIPDGVEVADAHEIMPTEHFIVHRENNSPAQHADRFRYLMMAKTDAAWVDTDVVCLQTWPNMDYVFSPYFKHFINNAVLRLPRNSPALDDLIDFTSNEYPVLPEGFPIKPLHRQRYDERVAAGDAPHISEMQWETWGPLALTHFLMQTGEIEHQLPEHVLSPFNGRSIKKTLRHRPRAVATLPEDSLAIHFYGTIMRGFLAKNGGVPMEKSLLARLCEQHEVDPASAPTKAPAA